MPVAKKAIVRSEMLQRRESHRGAVLFLGEPAVRQIHRIGRAAGPEQGTGDTAGEPGQVSPARGNDAPRFGASGEAVERKRGDERAQRERRGLPRQVDEQGDAGDGADEDGRDQARPFGAHRVLRILEADAEGVHQVHEHEQREREG